MVFFIIPPSLNENIHYYYYYYYYYYQKEDVKKIEIYLSNTDSFTLSRSSTLSPVPQGFCFKYMLGIQERIICNSNRCGPKYPCISIPHYIRYVVSWPVTRRPAVSRHTDQLIPQCHNMNDQDCQQSPP